MKRIIQLSLILCLSVGHMLTQQLPKITVLTSVFKGDKFIRNFMEEIVKQTIFDQSELLMIDANSPENERDVIFEFVERYPNIIYIRLAKDPGIYAVWNYGIHLSRGKYLTNANLDDRYDYRRFEAQSEVLDNDRDVDFVYSSFYRTNIANESFAAAKKRGQMVNMPNFIGSGYLFYYYFGNAPMWRKKFHDKYGLFDESLKSSGDSEMCTRGVYLGAKYKKLDRIYSYFYNNWEGISTRPDSPGSTEWAQIKEKYLKLQETNIKTIKPFLLPRPTLSYIFNVCDDWQECNDIMKELEVLVRGNSSELICIDFEKPKVVRDIIFKYMKKRDNIVYIKLPKKIDQTIRYDYCQRLCRGKLALVI